LAHSLMEIYIMQVWWRAVVQLQLQKEGSRAHLS
jgi:hypothetical protein